MHTKAQEKAHTQSSDSFGSAPVEQLKSLKMIPKNPLSIPLEREHFGHCVSRHLTAKNGIIYNYIYFKSQGHFLG